MSITKETALKRVGATLRALCIRVDTPRSLAVSLLAKYEEWDQLASLGIDPSTYDCPYLFAGDYGVTTFLKKNADLPSTFDKVGAAVAAFASSERHCAETNDVIRSYLSGGFCFPPAVDQVISLAQRKIRRLIGDKVDISSGPYNWGPGATFDLKRAKAYPDTKLTQLPFTVTGSAWKHAAKMIASDLHWKDAIIRANSDYTGPIFQIVPGGRYDTVPKTVLTDRSILVEPRLNTILQKSVGAQLRRLLKRVNVDLNDQSRNQYLAQMARPLNLATIDLESASDTVSRSVVELLLPPEWTDLLDDLRSKWYQDLNGQWLKLEKFSSMGNGFTFELESLIYWALASAASELECYSTVGIYGDDIIIRREVTPRLKEVLHALGFKVNTKKSFVEGNFFESCGSHFFKDIDVTPIYQKSIPVDDLDAARMGNRLLRWSARLGLNISLDKRIEGAWNEHFRQWTPHPDRTGPITGDGDDYWEVPSSQLALRHPRLRSSGGSGAATLVRTKAEEFQEIPADDSAMLALWFMSNSKPSSLNWRWKDLCVPRLNLGHETSVGMLTSRVNSRVVTKHRWVIPTAVSYLDW